ncbi:MAG: serine/threonine protein kinase [Deltaproteobacteria bacterium]|nr:serine/threonine protein kinase [Deltaproteobacteria bacterium]
MSTPRRIGRFLVFPAFAAGGMASVHLARMSGPLGFSRLCAVKRLHPHLTRDPEVVAMLLDEARLAARISSPHVVPILDLVIDDGELLVAMEHVRGLSLAELRRSESTYPPPVGVTVSIVVQMLRGLHAAHETRGDGGAPLHIVHRDVSPQNVVIDVDGLVRIIDFGVAKAAWRAQSSRTDDLKGKLGYMAPEQLRREPVDRRADVFGGSVVLWELLTGQRLFAAEGSEVLAARLSPSSAAPPSTVRRDVPVALDAIVARGLAASASARFDTADEMARALSALDLEGGSASIAEWVRGAGADRLAEREEQYSRVATWAVSDELSRSADGGVVGVAVGDASDVSDSTATAMMSSRTPQVVRTDRRRALGSVALVASALLAVGVVWSVRATTESASPPVTPAVSANPALAPSASSTDPVVAAPEMAASGSSALVPLPAVALAAAVAAAPSPSPKPRLKPAAANPCSPPWVVDDAGIRTFKLECL